MFIGKYKAIWAYGLRNPFTMTVDPSTDKLYINEVGEGTYYRWLVGFLTDINCLISSKLGRD
jgi:hypothetical protein